MKYRRRWIISRSMWLQDFLRCIYLVFCLIFRMVISLVPTRFCRFFSELLTWKLRRLVDQKSYKIDGATSSKKALSTLVCKELVANVLHTVLFLRLQKIKNKMRFWLFLFFQNCMKFFKSFHIFMSKLNDRKWNIDW